MIIYAVSRNDWAPRNDIVLLVYLGTSVKNAEESVGNSLRYAKIEREGGFPTIVSRKLYSALPQEIDREMIQFFMHGGQWHSIEMFELE